MILTNKAKEDFLRWNYSESINTFEIEDLELIHSMLQNQHQNADIIEWLDNIGYIIEPKLIDENWWGFSVIEKDIMGGYYELIATPLNSQFKNRQEAQEYAIKKVNEIYNLKFRPKIENYYINDTKIDMNAYYNDLEKYNNG